MVDEEGGRDRLLPRKQLHWYFIRITSSTENINITWVYEDVDFKL